MCPIAGAGEITVAFRQIIQNLASARVYSVKIDNSSTIRLDVANT
jgi:hypothetical protein